MTDISGSNTVSDGYNKPYTPTAEEVRDEYSFHCQGWCERCGESDDVSYLFHEAEFDRWLAEVKAEAWEEGYANGNADAFTEARLDRDNPYRQGETE